MSNSPEKIIVIDDEKRMCESLTTLLSDDGFDVQSFEKSVEAVEAVKSQRVDLVITDIKMPQMDGMAILKAVKAVDVDIPVILMTGFASINSAVEAVSLGAYDYLLKPVEFSQLTISVKRALEKRRSDISRRQILEELKISNLILKRRFNELNALYEAGKSIGSAANLKELLKQIVALASTVTEAKVGSIMLLDQSGKILTIEAAIGLEKSVIEETRLSLGTSIAGYVAKSGGPVIINDVEHDPRFKRINKERYGAASLLCAPLKIKNRVIGVINMANKQSGAAFTENDLRLLTTFASQAAVAVDDANQFEKHRRRIIEFEILHEITEELTEITSINAFRTSLLKKLQRVFPIDYGIWFNWDKQTRELTPDGATGTPDIPLTDSGGIDIRQTSRQSVTLKDIDLSEEILADVEQLSSFLKSSISEMPVYPRPGVAFMAIPHIWSDRMAYILCIGADTNVPYPAEDISLARLVVSQAALLYEREKSILNSTRLMTMGNMISEISHDLRRPLTSLRGTLQIIRKKWPEVAESSDFFRSAEEEIYRMNELVRELVDFSNPNRYETVKTDLQSLISKAAELLKPDMVKSGIKFESKFSNANWEIFTNRNQILEALLNIFMNAIDSMPSGGKLSVEGVVERPDHKKSDYLALKIRDTGLGIKSGDLSKIFDRYFTTKDSGTGLGLAVVERIISAHSGTLLVESEEGVGTTFSLYFPCQN